MYDSIGLWKNSVVLFVAERRRDDKNKRHAFKEKIRLIICEKLFSIRGMDEITSTKAMSKVH